jgi:hypothetical protein
MNEEKVITSSDVFTLRRSGDIERAYKMAQTLMENPNHSEWDIRAFAWCAIDLIKRAKQNNQLEDVEKYITELKKLEIDESDEILFKHIQYLLGGGSPVLKELAVIKELKESGKLKESAQKAKILYDKFPQEISVKRAYGWALYRLLFVKAKEETINFKYIQFYLDEIFSLGISNETLFMRCVWGSIVSIEDIEKQINLYQYALDTDFSCFEKSDYEPKSYKGKDEKYHEWPSLIIRILKKSLDSLDKKVDKETIITLCNLVEEKMSYLDENQIFLKWSVAKSYMLVNELSKAQYFILDLLQIKPREFWLWNGLAETIVDDSKLSLACYCKSLLCQRDLKFNGRGKIGVIKELIKLEKYDAASAEIQELVAYKMDHEQKLDDVLKGYLEAAWYIHDSNKNSTNFYNENSKPTLELLYKDIPWYEGIVGNSYTNDFGKMVSLNIVKTKSDNPVEIRVKKAILNGISDKKGTPIRAKIKWSSHSRGEVLIIEQIDSDVALLSKSGLVNHIIEHTHQAYVVVSGDVSIVCTYDEDNPLKVMDVISVIYSTYERKDGSIGTNVISWHKVDQAPPSSLVMTFENIVNVVGTVAFTYETNVFINNRFVEQYKLISGDVVSGTAIRSFNPKKREWGWRAIRIQSVEQDGYKKSPEYTHGDFY